MSKWTLPNSIKEYGYNHPIWTDRDLAKFVMLAFLAGVIVGMMI